MLDFSRQTGKKISTRGIKKKVIMFFFRIRNNTLINGKYITEIDVAVNKRTVKLEKHTFVVAKNRLKLFTKWVS